MALPDYEVACVNYSTAAGCTCLRCKRHVVRPRRATRGPWSSYTRGCKPLSILAEDLPSAAHEGRMVVTSFDTFHMVLCYVPNSGDGLKRLRERIDQWDVQLRERLMSLAATKPVVLMGDLNVAHKE